MNQTEAKVISFPAHRIVREVPLPAIEAAIAKGEKNQVDELIGDIATMIYGEFLDNGIDDDAEPFTKDFSFLVDILRATIYRNFKIKHHMHDFIDENVTVNENLSQIKNDAQEAQKE